MVRDPRMRGEQKAAALPCVKLPCDFTYSIRRGYGSAGAGHADGGTQRPRIIFPSSHFSNDKLAVASPPDESDISYARPSRARRQGCAGPISEVTMRTTRQGFTLIEILIVVIILGILAAIVIPNFS